MTLPPWAANGLPPPLPIICPANGEDCAEPGCPGGAKCVRKRSFPVTPDAIHAVERRREHRKTVREACDKSWNIYLELRRDQGLPQLDDDAKIAFRQGFFMGMAAV